MVDQHEAYQFFTSRDLSNEAEKIVLTSDDNEYSLQFLRFMPKLKHLVLNFDKPLSDEGMHIIESLPLKSLQISGGVDFSSQGAKSLGRLTTLEDLIIWNPKLADTTTLGNLKNLQSLSLEYRPRPISSEGIIGDEVMSVITKLENLRFLQLNGCRLTDAGADNLKHLSNIESVCMDDTNITDAKRTEIESHCHSNISRIYADTTISTHSADKKHTLRLTKMPGVFDATKDDSEPGYTTIIAGLPSQKPYNSR